MIDLLIGFADLLKFLSRSTRMAALMKPETIRHENKTDENRHQVKTKLRAMQESKLSRESGMKQRAPHMHTRTVNDTYTH